MTAYARLGVAIALLASAVVLAPVLVAAQADLITQAKRLDAQGKQDDAIALYRQALTRTPKSFDAHYGLARALDLNGSYADARSHFVEAIAQAPDDGSRDQATRMLGVSWTFVGNAGEATTAYTRVFNRRTAAGDFSGAAEVANELGRVLLELGRHDAAFDWYRAGYTTALRQPKRAERETDLAELRWAHAQARIAARRGNAREAETQAARVKSLLDKGTNADQRVQYPYLTGYVAFHRKDYARAIVDLQQADQEDPFILLLLAQAYERSGKAAEARTVYTRVFASTSHAVANAFARPVARQKLALPR